MKKLTFAVLLLGLTACGTPQTASPTSGNDLTGRWQTEARNTLVTLDLKQVGEQVSGTAEFSAVLLSGGTHFSVAGSNTDSGARLRLVQPDGTVRHQLDCQAAGGNSNSWQCSFYAESGQVELNPGLGSTAVILNATLNRVQ